VIGLPDFEIMNLSRYGDLPIVDNFRSLDEEIERLIDKLTTSYDFSK
jgi:hypothetical protein